MGVPCGIWFTLRTMRAASMLRRLGLASRWSQEAGLAALALALGFGLMPLLIFEAGAAALGRYDGASLGGAYAHLYRGLAGSTASWVVVLGPYGLFLLYKGLAYWWRASARLA